MTAKYQVLERSDGMYPDVKPGDEIVVYVNTEVRPWWAFWRGPRFKEVPRYSYVTSVTGTAITMFGMG